MSAAAAPAAPYSPGLEGVIAGETAISTIDDGLSYRGYPVTELAEQATFDEVAYLLLHGELPTPPQLADFRKRVAAARRLPEPLRDLLAGAAALDAADGRAAHGRQRAGPLRPGRRRTAAPTPTCARPSGCWARSRWPSPTTTASSKGLAAGAGARRTWRTPPTSCTCCAARKPHAEARAGPGRVADPVRRARVQRLDVHGPRGHLDRVGPALGHRRRPSARSRAGCTAGRTRR